MSDKSVSVSREINAPASVIFAILSDASKHSEIDGSGTVQGPSGDPQPLKLGSKFGMKMKMGLPYSISSTVVEFEPDELIAWAHIGRHRWRYELETIDESTTRVTETFDWGPSPVGKLLELGGYPRKHVPNMEKTLENLEQLVTAGT